ncbi:MAG: rhomboid family intramembrane serine protease [Candidatus Bathyarchaeota archaeon]|nr:rhomboid family intramembrane serine protease [Candidatus Bathyarchaeota archaeon]MDH5635630.1 rhomboid family intramembrane serine protease [Candidatus Bathyarchaeota archaeon]
MASRVAVVTYLLIAVNVLVFCVQLSDPDYYYEHLIPNYGLIPTHVMEGKNLFTLITSLFLHADIFHLGMNMLFLLIAGDGCERAMGSSRFLVFYLACGVLSGLFHAYLNSTSSIATIGASGAIFGVLAAFAILFPFRWLISLFGLIPVPVPAIIFVFLTVLIETAYVASGVADNVAHTAHVGGFLAGVFLTLLFGPRKHEIDEQLPRNLRVKST